MPTGSGTTGNAEWPGQAFAARLGPERARRAVVGSSIRGNLALPQGQGLAEAEGTQPGVIPPSLAARTPAFPPSSTAGSLRTPTNLPGAEWPCQDGRAARPWAFSRLVLAWGCGLTRHGVCSSSSAERAASGRRGIRWLLPSQGGVRRRPDRWRRLKVNSRGRACHEQPCERSAR